MKCPASMCPLVAPDGSPWTGEFDAVCPEAEPDFDKKTGCAWWGMGCNGCGGYVSAHKQIGEAADEGKVLVAGPNKPKRTNADPRKVVWDYDCPRAKDCQWQAHAEAEGGLCPPRSALRLGLDPRVCLF